MIDLETHNRIKEKVKRLRECGYYFINNKLGGTVGTNSHAIFIPSDATMEQLEKLCDDELPSLKKSEVFYLLESLSAIQYV